MGRAVVADSSVVLAACGGLRFPGDWQWCAPSLVCSEVLSALHEALWRGELTRDEADAVRLVFAALPLQLEDSARLRDEAWRIADELGFAKTYEAEVPCTGPAARRAAGDRRCQAATRRRPARVRRGPRRAGTARHGQLTSTAPTAQPSPSRKRILQQARPQGSGRSVHWTTMTDCANRLPLLGRLVLHHERLVQR